MCKLMDSHFEPSIHGKVGSLLNTFEWVGMTGYYGDRFISKFIQLWDGNNSHSISKSCTSSPSCYHNHIVSYKYTKTSPITNLQFKTSFTIIYLTHLQYALGSLLFSPKYTPDIGPTCGTLHKANVCHSNTCKAICNYRISL